MTPTYKKSEDETICCGTCLKLYDESCITACMLHAWDRVQYDGVCEDWSGCK